MREGAILSKVAVSKLAEVLTKLGLELVVEVGVVETD
jgi:hypothetical protein